MVKEEFVREVANRTGLRQVDISKSLENGFEIIGERLKEGEPVIFRGFGTFKIRHRAERNGRPPDVVPSFKPGKELKRTVSYKVIT